MRREEKRGVRREEKREKMGKSVPGIPSGLEWNKHG